jgi:hypothetical protein
MSTDNVFTAGTLDLQASNDGVTFTDGVSATFNETNMAPGAAATTGTVTLKNAGTIAADHFEMKFAVNSTNVVTAAEILGFVGDYANGTATDGSTTTLVDTAIDTVLTQEDDYWNGKVLFVCDDNMTGEARLITDFVNATHTLTVSPAFSSAVGAGTTYSIIDMTGTADSGTVDTLVDDALTQADDYWVGKTLHILSGDNAGESQVITGFVNLTNEITVGSPFSNAIDAGDQYVITEVDNTNYASVLEVTDVEIGDTVLTFGSILAEIKADLSIATVHLSDLDGYKYVDDEVVAADGEKVVQITVQLPAAVDNGSQGDSSTMNITFGLMQDASQTLP